MTKCSAISRPRHGALANCVLLAVSAFMLTGASALGQSVARLEMHPVQTVTLKNQQFLTGDLNGTPAVLAGELRIPRPGTEKLPAVVLVHGSGGLSALHDRWAQELNSIGIAAFILDSFTGRGIVSTVNDQSQIAC